MTCFFGSSVRPIRKYRFCNPLLLYALREIDEWMWCLRVDADVCLGSRQFRCLK
jgi:hypothetical protein